MPDTFKGFNTDLLIKIKHIGKSVVGNDELYEAAQEYTDPSKGGGRFGPALTSTTPGISVTPPQTRAQVIAHAPVEAPAADAKTEPESDPWSSYDLLDLRDKMKAHSLPIPRALSYGKAIDALEAAGVKP